MQTCYEEQQRQSNPNNELYRDGGGEAHHSHASSMGVVILLLVFFTVQFCLQPFRPLPSLFGGRSLRSSVAPLFIVMPSSRLCRRSIPLDVAHPIPSLLQQPHLAQPSPSGSVFSVVRPLFLLVCVHCSKSTPRYQKLKSKSDVVACTSILPHLGASIKPTLVQFSPQKKTKVSIPTFCDLLPLYGLNMIHIAILHQ